MNKLALLLTLPVIVACATPPMVGLVGGPWRFERIDGAPPVSDRAQLEFHADRIGGTVGCNGIGGEWRLRGSRIMTGPWVSTQMYCEGLMDQEAAISALFAANPTYAINGNRLTLTGGGHTAVLVRGR